MSCKLFYEELQYVWCVTCDTVPYSFGNYWYCVNLSCSYWSAWLRHGSNTLDSYRPCTLLFVALVFNSNQGHVEMLLLFMFSHTKNLVRFTKGSCFCWKYLFWSQQTQQEMSQLFVKKHQFCLKTNTARNCPQVYWNMSSVFSHSEMFKRSLELRLNA